MISEDTQTNKQLQKT